MTLKRVNQCVWLVGLIFFMPIRSGLVLAETLTGTIKIDGSSTVYPITEAVAEEFQKTNPNVKVTVGISGTGGGFKKFGAGETDISDASRPIKSVEEELATKAGIQYIELPIAYDALTVVVNPQNTWANSMTVADLKKIWEPEAQGKIMRWSQVRSDWPDQPIHLFGPGVDSGTYDYFTEAVVGKEHSSRGDFTSSEDDNVLVQGVANDKNALGFFGMAYYEENQSRVKAVAIDDGNDSNGKGAIPPSAAAVISSTYRPLSRPLFIYVKKAALDRPEVKEFVSFYLRNASKLVTEVGYVQLPEAVSKLALERFNDRKAGSAMAGMGHLDVKLEDILRGQTKAQG